MNDVHSQTNPIADCWAPRWPSKRIERNDVLDAIEREELLYLIGDIGRLTSLKRTRAAPVVPILGR
jgi:hypothetical protein